MAIAVVARSLASSSSSSFSTCSHITFFLSKRFFLPSSHPAVFGPSHFAGLGGLRPSSSILSRPTVGLVVLDAFGVSLIWCMASDSRYSPLNSGSGGTNPFIMLSIILADMDQARCTTPFIGGGTSSDPVAAFHLFLSMLCGPSRPTQATLSSLS